MSQDTVLFCVRAGDDKHVVDRKTVRETRYNYVFGESARNQLGYLHSPFYAHQERVEKCLIDNAPGIDTDRDEAIKSHIEGERRRVEACEDELRRAKASLELALELAQEERVEIAVELTQTENQGD